MGTRADFYKDVNGNLEWIGSIGLDGYPEHPGIPKEFNIITATSESEYLERVESMLAGVDHCTRPEQGWPWTNGRLTDYSYRFFSGEVELSSFGYPWLPVSVYLGFSEEQHDEYGEQPKVEFPDMSDVQKVTLGHRSGAIVISSGGIVREN